MEVENGCGKAKVLAITAFRATTGLSFLENRLEFMI